MFLPLLTSPVLGDDLPPAKKIEYASYAVTSEGKLIGYFGDQHRVDIKSTKNVSKHVINALIATEDRDFYNHDGVSYKGLGRAILKTLTGSTQGGSTLTMQLARNLYLSTEQTLSRKFTEIGIARDLEKKYTKDQILLMYLNTVNFGHGAWGIWAAAQHYFGKTPNKLTITESATIVGFLKNPNGYDPAKNPDRILSRRNEVLYNLVEVGKLSEKEFNRLKKQPLGFKINDGLGRHFLEHVRKEAVAILNSRGISLSRDQIKITTTLSYDIQKAAEDAVFNQYQQFPSSMKQAQVGLVAVEPETGKIRAMVGGNPWSESRGLNHADEIHRQPGSALPAFSMPSRMRARTPRRGSREERGIA
jgi:membrane peptidoglycan carboxypeptidase